MEKNYSPGEVEPRWEKWWIEHGAFHASARDGGEPYCIVIPPPNVTGVLHMGHALNNTIQDILARWRRMQGRNVVWMPGTDHAGIATQNVVERALAAEGATRDRLGREAFVERVWRWRDEYGGTIIRQLKRLGASCDWARERFTMDAGLSDAVAEVFVRLYNKGLIVRGKYIINWCPRCRTALSDEESEHADTAGKLYYIRYPLKGGRKNQGVTVATTRPETLLGDTAVAVNPADRRFAARVGKTLLLPVLGREIPVIADAAVDRKFGTGAVKVTPAHDPTDFEIGRRHGLAQINVMGDDGTMNAEAGPYAGMDRIDCRRRMVADLEAQGLLVKVEPHQHAVGHCYRCHTAVEPRLSEQWFVKMKPLAAPAIEAVRSGRVRFVPDRWTKVYLEWMENIRDWCISRQIWWGHRIPVFTCARCGREWAQKGVPAACGACGAADVRQEADVLDTWFSSWLWPFSTFGWPEANEDLRFYYPTSALVTAPEIIFFWVARMIMAGIEFMGDVPFRDVYIHGTVRDEKGRKMSKSLGNAIDPLTVIDKFSADALRFSLMMLTATGQDLFLSDEKFEIGRNFATKLWNAARYLQMQSAGFAPEAGRTPDLDPAHLSADDAHMLWRLGETAAACTAALEKFRFNDMAQTVYEFLWHEFCDWYVEYSKDVLYAAQGPRRDAVLRIAHHVFESALRLLHPLMPFVTEELWHAMGYGREGETIAKAAWPAPFPAEQLSRWGADESTVRFVADKHELVRAGRALRADYNIPPSRQVDFIVKPETVDAGRRLESDMASLVSFLKAGRIAVDAAYAPPRATPSLVSRLGTIFMPVEGILDRAVEFERLSKELQKVEEDLARVTQKLQNANFVQKAPEEVVAQQRRRGAELAERREKLQRLMGQLSA